MQLIILFFHFLFTITEFVKSDIFGSADSLRKNCQKYKPISNLPKLNTTNLKDLSLTYRTNMIRADINNQILYCLPAKTGATNWGILTAAIKRNVSINEIYDLVPNINNNIYTELTSLSLLKTKLFDEIPLTDEKGLYQFFKTENYPNSRFLAFYANFKGELPRIKHGMLLARHPLLRLYSTWSHRFSDANPHHYQFFLSHINYIKKHFGNSSFPDPPKGIFVKLDSFLRYAHREIIDY